jgi:AraC-like DNA-binding protein
MSSAALMVFTELEAAAELRAWVDCYWQFRVEPDAGAVEHWVPPDGGISLVFDPRSGFLGSSGPFLAPFRPPVAAGDLRWGVRFWPGAGQALLGVAAEATRDKAAPLEHLTSASRVETLRAALSGAATGEAVAAAFDAGLSALVAQSRPLDPAVMTAVFRIVGSHGREGIAAVAEAVGLSPRQLRRRFRAVCGVTAKELARVRRFRASAVERALGSTEAWVAIAADHGYADQAHLVHEYRRLVGLSPKAFEQQFAKIRHRLLGR